MGFAHRSFARRARHLLVAASVGLGLGAAACTVPPPGGPTPTDVAVTQHADNQTPAFGQAVQLTTTVANEGTATATGVAASVTLPAGLTFVSAPAQYDATSGTWTIGSLAGGASTHLTITARAGDVAIGDRTVNATVHATADPNAANNTASVTLSSVPARIKVAIVPDPGNPQFIDIGEAGTVTWTASVTNENDPTAAVNDVQSFWQCSTVSFNPCPGADGFTHDNEPLTIVKADFGIDTYTISALANTTDPNYTDDLALDSVTFTTTNSG